MIASSDASKIAASRAVSVLRRAQQLLPGAQTVTLPEATHHTMPTEDAACLAREIGHFLG